MNTAETGQRYDELPLGHVVTAMIAHEQGNIRRIAHALKMHGYALAIAAGEGVKAKELTLLQAAAILHDVGISAAIRQHGESTRQLQEELGAIVAREILLALGWPESDTERVCFLIGNHHSYDVDGGILLQIIFEADYCVNFQEGSRPDTSAEDMLKLFVTSAGKALFAAMHIEG